MLGLEPGNAARVLRGVTWDSDTLANSMLLFARGFPEAGAVGEIIRAAYSPALGAMIGYCVVDADMAAPGTELVLRPSGTDDVPVRVTAPPFLP